MKSAWLASIWIGMLLAASVPAAENPVSPSDSTGDADVSDLPLQEVKAAGPGKDVMAILITGDGGWAYFVRRIASRLADSGVPTVGLNSFQYLFHRKSPQAVSADLARIMRHYGKAWGRDRFLLIGYSLGADVFPTMINGLPPGLRGKIASLTLLGAAQSYDLEFHVTEWLWSPREGNLPLLPEVEKLRGMRILCIYGKEESESLCPDLPADLATTIPMTGGHHFGGAFGEIAGRILQSDSAGADYLPNRSPR
ncbi:MAG: acid virulence protein [Fibrobacteres bacterium]|nr:acid virulence protein [Fibrobacterota bacterium]